MKAHRKHHLRGPDRRLRPNHMQQMLWVIAIIAPVLLAGSRILTGPRPSASVSGSARTAEKQARLSDEVTIKAAGRGNPWISLSDGYDVITSYAGPKDLVKALEQNQALHHPHRQKSEQEPQPGSDRYNTGPEFRWLAVESSRIYQVTLWSIIPGLGPRPYTYWCVLWVGEFVRCPGSRV
jgi:hypothetical protein